MELWLAALLPHALTLLALRFGGAGTRRAAAVFTAAVLLYFAPYLVRGETPVSLDFLRDAPPWEASAPEGALQKNFLLNDVPLQILPWREAVREAVLAGEPPFLDRRTATGAVLWENLQTAVLFPTTWLGLPFSTFAWPMLTAVTRILVALWGTWFFVGRLGLGTWPRIYAAIAVGFGAFTIAFLGFPVTNVTTLLPWMLWAVDGVARRPDRRSVGAAGLVLFLMLAGGHPESVLHSAFVVLPYAALLVARSTEGRARLVGRYLVVGLLGVALAAPVLVPFLAYLPHSQRLDDIERLEGFLAVPAPSAANLVTLVVPNYYGNPRVHNYRHPFVYHELVGNYVGTTTLVLALCAAFRRRRALGLWTGLGAFCFLLAFQPAWMSRLLAETPILSHGNHGRIRFALGFVVAVLAAHGLEDLLVGRGRRVVRAVAAVTFALVVAICLGSYPVFAEFGIRRLIFFTELAPLAGLAFLALPAVRGVRLAGPALVVLLLVDVVGVALLFNPGNGRERFYPETPAIAALERDGELPPRVLGLGRTLMPLASTMFGIEDVRTHDPMAFRPYVAFLESHGYDRSTYFEQFPELPDRELLDFLGVRYVVAEPGAALPPGAVVHDGEDARVAENPTPLRRYFVPDRVVEGTDPDRDPRVVSGSAASVPASAEILRVERDRRSTLLEIRADGESLVATSEAALPGWRLRRDGEPWPLEILDGAFLGWSVPPGPSHFELVYRPVGLLPASLVALGALLVTLLLLRFPEFRSRGRRRQ